jgi:quinol monooxygenase YgiN
MTFVQTISFTTTRIDEIRKLAEEYERQQAGRAPGYRRYWVLEDRDEENAYMVSVEFESHELAMENSARPETDAFATKLRDLVDGEPTYRNYDLIAGEGSGSSW